MTREDCIDGGGYVDYVVDWDTGQGWVICQGGAFHGWVIEG
ncbi:hypothetical protein [Streptomyces sp. NPDC007984]